jgi:hypothetical protein
MPNISDLPLEILELIFSHLISTPPPGRPHVRRPFLGTITGAPLRLVCRAWADALYEHYLYRRMRFSTASRSLAFIDYLGRRPQILPRAKCLYLEVENLWPFELPLTSSPPDAINSEILESLLELFSDSITTLDLKFNQFFALPSQKIKAIGRVNKLDNLQRHPQRLYGDSELTGEDATCFNSLMMEAQGFEVTSTSVTCFATV